MSGIYIHIPFCRQKCHYCNFYSLASRKNIDRIAGAIAREMALRKDYLGKQQVDTIYIGGGTPSMLDVSSLERIFSAIWKHFSVSENAEITLEANPEDVDREKLKSLRSSPVNRLSLGVQSFHDEDLHYLHRVHNGKKALESILLSQEAGFSNLSIDLIYGIPTLTDEKWLQNLEKAVALNIGHISAYSLTIEPKTALDFMIAKGRLAGVNEEDSVNHFLILMEIMENHGYQHYEISNFARDGMIARHNTGYWRGMPYLGLGPSAHSYNGRERHWNISNTGAYIESISKGELLIEEEIIESDTAYNEYILTSLRTIWGIDMQYIMEHMGEKYVIHAQDVAKKFLSTGMLDQHESTFYLTREGRLFADGVAMEFFIA